MTIPSQITNPKGCNQEEIELFYGECFYQISCGKENPVSKEIIICNKCKNIQKAQAQTLLDEKKSELEFLDKVPNNRGEISKKLYKIIFDKIQELQSEIKVLEGVLK